jgi:hypothetical protein
VQELNPSSDGLIANMISFNVGGRSDNCWCSRQRSCYRLVAQDGGVHETGGARERRDHGGRIALMEYQLAVTS